MRAILAYLTTKPGKEAQFQEQMTAQAKRCLANEPGCLQFDVVQDPKEPTRFVMLEVYKRRRRHQGPPGQPALQGLPPGGRRPHSRPQGRDLQHGVGRQGQALNLAEISVRSLLGTFRQAVAGNASR